ncbi:MAG: PAS domain-containing sensor histidine kinase, partial [Desulfobacterales bacterium]
VAVDITSRKQAQKDLDRVKGRLYDIIDLGTGQLETITESLRLIIDKIPVMICCYDDSRRILFVNRAFEDIVGWSLSEARRMDIMSACYPDPEIRSQAMAFMGSDRSDWQDFPLSRRSGEILDTSWTNVPLNRSIRIGIGIDITQRKRAEKALRRLSRKTLEMLEGDRQSVAKELHDSIGASLAAIKFSLEGRLRTMGEAPTDGELPIETIIDHLAETIKESKRISNGLRPLTLDDLGLLPTLTAYIRQLKESYPDVDISQSIELKESDLPDAMKIVLYRVAQEALNNIHKHSRATKASLRLKRGGDTVELTVEDDGCGFDIASVLEGEDPLMGYGLKSMQERVEICGGSFHIRSRDGAGTTIVAAIPLA